MANLDRIVNVNVTLRTTGITERSFSDMLILGTHLLSPGRVMVITGADELLDLGLNETDPLYLAAADAFSQIPAVRQVYIGRRQVDTVTVGIGAVSISDYTARLQWRGVDGNITEATATYVGKIDDDAADIATGLTAAINATAAPVTAAVSSGSVTITNDDAGDPLAVHLDGNLTMVAPTSSESITASLAAVNSEMSNWYGLVITSREVADVLDAAGWAESNEKLFGTASADPGVLDAAVSTDIGSRLLASQYFRSFVMFDANAAVEYPEAARMANRFTFYAGTETWSLQKLAGITYDALSEGQAIAAHNKNVTTFELFRNFAVTQGGKTAAGEWIDVIRLRDQLVDQIKVSVVSAMVNADGKVPYTDDGIQIIGNAIRGPLDLNVRRGGLAPEELDSSNNVIPSYRIILPRSSDIPFNDKANRILRDVKFTARLSGAIHVVEINGSLSYAL